MPTPAVTARPIFAPLVFGALTAWLVPHVWAQQAAETPAPALEWSNWYVLGPFDNPGGVAVEQSLPPEKRLSVMKAGEPWPYLGEEYDGKGGATLRWTSLGDPFAPPQGADTPLLDLLALVPAPEGVPGWSDQAAAYLYRLVEAREATTIPVVFGSDDGVRFWVNGELLVDHGVPRGVNVRSERAPLRLVAGQNHILVKVANGGGAWGFQMQRERRVEQARIDGAIDKGVEYLVSSQLLDGSWGAYQNTYRNGQTALTVYALLKSGVSSRHSSVLRALAWLRQNPPVKTYSMGCQLLALGATRDPEHQLWMEELLGDLLSWQGRSSGVWAYPEGDDDLSCTQFAALGLRAATEAGLDVPAAVFEKLATGVMEYQQKLGRAALKDAYGFDQKGKVDIGGFAYKRSNPKNPTGSMTTAGVATLEICRIALGDRLGVDMRHDMDRAQAAGIHWLVNNFSVSHNPNRGDQHLYYLYGMERVGSLLKVEQLGERQWYWEGAEFLVGAQKPDGSWAQDGVETGTCFALLFLSRATGAAVTNPDATPVTKLGKSDPAAGPIELRVVPGSPASFWLHAVHEVEGETAVFDEVEYLARTPDADWQVVANAQRHNFTGLATERFPGRYLFPKPGEWQVMARARVADGEVVSGVVTVAIETGARQEDLSYTADAARNLLARGKPAATASSGNAIAAVDNHWYSAWLCDGKDVDPQLEVRLKRGVKAQRIVFSHARNRPREQVRNPRPAWIELWVNGDRDPQVIEIDPNFLAKTVVELDKPKTVTRIRVRVIEVIDGVLGVDAVGFAEIELQADGR